MYWFVSFYVVILYLLYLLEIHHQTLHYMYRLILMNHSDLKKHLKETCSIEAETGAIVVNSKDKDGGKTNIADDTWRTAGTSQKVASGFGSDMKDCVKSKVAADRSGV